MADASELYMANGSLLDDPRLHGAPMIVALSGYADAGHLAEQVRETLLGGLPSEVLARFDSDQLHDYRARRPHVRFVQDHFERIEGPELALHLVTDPLGQHFTVLSGPEPDLHWERFLDAVMDLVQRMCDHVAVMDQGRVLAQGTMDEVCAGMSLEDRFVSLVGGRTEAGEGLQWLRPE